MQLKYFIPVLSVALFSIGLHAQNRPEIYETAPQGAVQTFSLLSETYPGSDPNSVRTYMPMLPLSDANTVNANSPAVSVKQQLMFMDGFNRPFQVITRNVSTVGGQQKHLVQLFHNGTEADQYSFLPYATTDGNLQTSAYLKQKGYYGTQYPGEGYTSFSKSVNNSTADARQLISYAPGKSQIGQSHGTLSKVIANAASEVRYWEVEQGAPVSKGFYAANELFGTETILPSWNAGDNGAIAASTKVYTDRDGKVILKMVADSSYRVPDGAFNFINKNTYQCTYYVYDKKGNLRYTITPKAYAFFEQNGYLSEAVVKNLCFYYAYDRKGRMAATRKPGEEDITAVVYDRKDRVVMRQTPNEKVAAEWEVIFYDVKNRVKATAVYTDSKGYSGEQWQTLIEEGSNSSGADNLLFYLCTAAGEKAYPYGGDPYSINGIIDNAVMMSYTWYDHYAQAGLEAYWNDCQSRLNFVETHNGAGAEVPLRSNRIEGMMTGSMVRVLRSDNALAENLGDWRVSVNFYDDKGRVINAVTFTDDETSGAGRFNFDYSGVKYDFTGRPLLGKHVLWKHNVQHGQNKPVHAELTKYEYDGNSGSLTKTSHKVDAGAWAVLSNISYDDQGRVKRKDLGGGGEVQDYSYNIRGQLTGINGVYVETGNRQGVSRSFGEILKYDFGFTKPRFDGKMAGIVWRGSSEWDLYSYGYSYTHNQSLKNAEFYYLDMGQWSPQNLDFSVSNLFYDKNGNIKSMNQRGMAGGGLYTTDVDLLQYDYQPESNRLDRIKDDGYPYVPGDFKDGNTNGPDYDYDRNGNTITDLNRGIHMEYQRFNKPKRIQKDDGSTIEYSYDASGNKLEEIINDKVKGYKRTDYIGNAVYWNEEAQNSAEDKLQFLLTAEGRTVLNTETGGPIKEEYFVKDHLGNVRSTVNVLTYSTRNYLASYEMASAHLENLVFDKLDDVRTAKPGGEGDNTMAANLNGMDGNRRVGSSLLVKVMAGDKVSMNVNTYYTGFKAKEDKPITTDMALQSVVSTLTGGVNGFAGEGHNTKLVSAAFTTGNFAALSNIISTNYTDVSKPRAYLNYVLFDDRMNIVTGMTGAFQASGEDAWAEVGTTGAMEIPKNGYLAVYLSNSSQQSTMVNADVYFDQLRFTVTKGQLLEETHYYPFGLPIQLLSGDAEDGFKENLCKYQGNELIKGLDLNLMDFHARQYDPQTGRFLSVDPLADFNSQDMFSPYAAMGNMPESMIDPNGLSFDGHKYSRSPSSPDGGSGVASYAGLGRTGGAHSEEMHPPSLTGMGGLDAGFSSMGLSALSINTFWNITFKSVKAQVNSDYGGYMRHKEWQDDIRAEADAKGGSPILLTESGNIDDGIKIDGFETVGKKKKKKGGYWNNSLENGCDLARRFAPTKLGTLGPIPEENRFRRPNLPALPFTYEQLGKINTAIGNSAWIASFTRFSKIAGAVSWTSLGIGFLMDSRAAATGKITWTKVGVNTAFGAAGNTSSYFAPIAVFYFTADAFGVWDNLATPAPSDPPPGYENVNIGDAFSHP